MSAPPGSSSHTTNSALRTVFPKGPSFSLQDFSSRDFIVKEFIESLSDSAISTRRSVTGATGGKQSFDPKPFIRTFEHAQRRITELSGDLEIRENELSAAVRRAEAQHTQNLNTLGTKLQQAIEAFQRLDTSLNGPGTLDTRVTARATDGGAGTDEDYAWSTGNMAVETGRRLEELDRQRRRALDAHFLIECWDQVSNRGEITLLENLRRSGSAEAKVRSAQIARQLLRISQRLDSRTWNGSAQTSTGLSYGNGSVEGQMANDIDDRDGGNGNRRNTREIIEKFSETLEKDLLNQFDDFYRKANFEGMYDCAKVLQDFNGGVSVVALFVNQHQFFIDRSQLIGEEVSAYPELWEKLADPVADPPTVQPSLQSLVDEVKVVVQEESAIIKRAFPYYEQVLCKFLQRVFQQSIQQRLEMVLEKANSVSSLAFLRSLQISRNCISALVDDLKAHGLTEHPDTISSQTALVLDQQLEDLFVPYFVGSSYIEKEKRNLDELYTSLLFKFTTFHARRKKAATTFMASLAKSGSELLASARDAYISRLESADLTSMQKRMLLQVAGLKDSSDASKQLEIKLTEEDGQLSLAYAKRMLKWLAEGVGRSLELGVSSETPKDVAVLLNLLLSVMGEGYIEVGVDAILDAATGQESGKTEPDFSYLPTLRTAISITHLMVMCVNTVLVPLVGGSITVRREMEKRVNLLTNRVEEKVNTIEQKAVDATIAWVSKLLSGQKRNDFRPREGDTVTWLERLQTPTCGAICAFLTRLHNIAVTSLPANSANIRQLLTEIALGVGRLLLDHFKNFAVNAPGGLMVTKDMTQYATLLKSWGVDESIKNPGGAIDVLLEVGNLFVIGAEALQEKMRGGATAVRDAGRQATSSGGGRSAADSGLSVQEMRAYVSRREDSNTPAIQSLLSGL